MTLLEKIERGLYRIHLDRNMKDNIHLIELRMAVTFKNFGNDPFEEQAKDSKIVTEIAVAVDKMISCIDDSVIKL